MQRDHDEAKGGSMHVWDSTPIVLPTSLAGFAHHGYHSVALRHTDRDTRVEALKVCQYKTPRRV